MEVESGIYEHYKGKRYKVIGLAKHSETEENLVVYKPLYKVKERHKGLMWVRPKTMFFEKVLIDGKKVPRFKYLSRK